MINTALERPDLVERVVADSFDGRTLGDDFAENLLQERKNANCRFRCCLQEVQEMKC